MNYFKNNLVLKIKGASHSKKVTLECQNIIDLPINYDSINEALLLRRGIDEISTPRRENDEYVIVKKDNKIIITVFNNDVKKVPFNGTIRPGHADLVQLMKYNKESAISGGGISSGRMSVPFVILATIFKDYLNKKGIYVKSLIKRIGEQEYDSELNENIFLHSDDYLMLNNPKDKEKAISYIKQIKNKRDSLDGEVKTYIKCPYIGLGEPYFNSMESLIAHLMFSIPGINGIKFGDALNPDLISGSKFNDIPYFDNDVIKYRTNHAGGIQGGLTNGQCITFTTSIRPTSSIGLTQDTINIKTKENVKINITSRNDPCIVPRALHVINAMSYIVMMDQFLERSQDA